VSDQNPNGTPIGDPEDHFKPEDHLAHLLPPASIEKPWFLEIFKNIKELISPPKLPPLEITSKPVPIHEIKIYAGNEAKSGFLSLAIHIGVIALLRTTKRNDQQGVEQARHLYYCSGV
jgi:periplasmic protein TonB